MAGHSKWKNIQHRKGAQDARRGKIFTKIAVELTVATRQGGPNPDDNPRLRTALAKAKAANMPKENWQRAIKKGSGESTACDYLEKIYEGYGPGGVAVIVECLTDNINRTVSEVRHAFSRASGNLGTEGSVSWIFDRKGMLVYAKEDINNWELFFETALEHGAEDVNDESTKQYEVSCASENLHTLKSALDSFCKEPKFCEITRIPKNFTVIDTQKAQTLDKMIATLEDNDDVQNVYHNGESS